MSSWAYINAEIRLKIEKSQAYTLTRWVMANAPRIKGSEFNALYEVESDGYDATVHVSGDLRDRTPAGVERSYRALLRALRDFVSETRMGYISFEKHNINGDMAGEWKSDFGLVKVAECRDEKGAIRIKPGRELVLDVEHVDGLWCVNWNIVYHGHEFSRGLAARDDREGIEKEVQETLLFLWQEYAMCEDSQLTEGAKGIKYVMLEWFEEVRE